MPTMRWLILIHRYLGIAVGLLMAVWCLSGIVMMYAHYPELDEPRRVAALPQIGWQGCCRTDDLPADAKVERAEVEMLFGRPVLRVRLAGQPAATIDLTTGHPARIGETAATAVAQALSDEPPPAPELIHDDQWTVAGGFRRDRPLYRFDFADAQATRLYVSSTTGKAVQMTTRRQRVLAWAGAIPHWFYFTGLRRDVMLWSQVVIWTSLTGCFLTITGLWIGIKRLKRGRSPYRGLMFWHHMTGLMAGLLVLTWMLSGLLSMNPWGALEGDGAETEHAALRGPPPTVAQFSASLNSLAATAAGAASLTLHPFDGAIGFVAVAHDGTRRRLNAEGKDTPNIDPVRLATLLGTQPGIILTDGDAYYFNRRQEPIPLPVVRLTNGSVRNYIDPVSAEILQKFDGRSRWYRWLHDGLHRLDFFPSWRTGLFRNFVMLPLLLVATAVCCIGAYLGMRRLIRDLS
jgi:uncharacterized iron-regulated membrane protein